MNNTLMRVATCKEESTDNEDELKEVQPAPVVSANAEQDEDMREAASTQRKLLARRCPFPGVDMECIEGEDGLTDLHFAIKFKKMRGDSEPIADIVGKRAVQESATITIEKEDMLRHNRELWEVQSVSEDKATVVIVRCFGRDKEETTITMEEATHLVNECNS